MVLNEVKIPIVSMAVAVCIYLHFCEKIGIESIPNHIIYQRGFFCLFFLIPDTYFADSVMTNFNFIPLHCDQEKPFIVIDLFDICNEIFIVLILLFDFRV